MKFDEVQKLRDLCIENAEDFVRSAKLLTGKNVLYTVPFGNTIFRRNRKVIFD